MMATLYTGGTIRTMTAPDATVEALLTDDRGHIVFAGDLEQARDRARSMVTVGARHPEERDLAGACLMPGFIDSHSHFAGMGQRLTDADLAGCADFAEIGTRLKTFLAAHPLPAGGVLHGFNYDQNELAEGVHPDRHVLDALLGDVPTVIAHVSGHVIICNTALLKLIGLDLQQSEAPAGGVYGRDENGELNGYFAETPAIMPILMHPAVMPKKGIEGLVGAIQDEYASHGITTCQDGATAPGYAERFVKLAEAHKLKLDLTCYPMMGQDLDAVFDSVGSYASGGTSEGIQYLNHLRFGGVKLFVDGSPQARGAWLSEPYKPLPASAHANANTNTSEPAGYRGAGILSDEAMRAFLDHALERGWKVMAHCNGDAASEQFLTQYTAAYRASSKPDKFDLRPVMVHCQLTRRDQYARMAAVHMIPSIFVSHCWFWGDAHIKNLGFKRASRISAVHDALSYNLPFTFHTDSPIVPPDLIFAAWCAMTRVTKYGVALDQTQCVGAWEAFSAITRNAAYQYGEEARKGTLEAGKLADMTILDTDPLAVSTQPGPHDPQQDRAEAAVRVRKLHVLETIKEGTTVWTA
ncbi:amidohydrolase [Bifidobacterium olomucense]|nr:amidohydrolase [Bifidobacterium sp. DSM 109959]